MDLTLRLASKPEIEVEPDGTVECMFRAEDGSKSCTTLLLTPEVFRTVVDKGLELSALGRLPYAQPGE
jgi:hypothetical protein